MENTGYTGYTTLEEYFVDNGLATGSWKNNLSSDPDYVAPIWDTGSCPTVDYIIEISTLQIDFALQGNSGDYLANITSNYGQLEFNCSETWFQVSPGVMSGPSAGGYLFVSCEETTWEREGIIAISSNAITVGEIRIFQTGY
jgi:hypothetical protein